jgi:hypothetical protein
MGNSSREVVERIKRESTYIGIYPQGEGQYPLGLTW